MGSDDLKIDVNDDKSVFIAQLRVDRKVVGLAQLNPDEELELYKESLS
jgi:hypothetical protein